MPITSFSTFKNRKTQKLTLLKEKLKNYPDWDSWSKTSFCLLPRKQIIAVNNYLKFQDHRITAEELYISYAYAAMLLNDAIKRLDRYPSYYREWKEYRNLQESGFLSRCRPEVRKALIPVSGLGLSGRTLRLLQAIDCYYLKDLLCLDKKELSKYRGAGKEMIKELNTTMQVHGFPGVFEN